MQGMGFDGIEFFGSQGAGFLQDGIRNMHFTDIVQHCVLSYGFCGHAVKTECCLAVPHNCLRTGAILTFYSDISP
ncbi:hypothetical protein Defa_24010 [Desulfovibrio sp. TH_2024_36128]|uniref:Uncharacterized protein n=1 Tax=Desulfovibrio falkowii TaxID=3136602 RepID=A0ABQ0EAS4_9BACT